MELLEFLRTLHVFHSGCTDLHNLCKLQIYISSKRTLFSFLFFFFATFSPTLVISCLLYNNHTDRCEVISCGFDLHFLMISDVGHFFIYLLAICMCSLEKCLIRYSTHVQPDFLNLLFFFCYWVV